ncbi:hypothetical protein BKA82DRAFT_4440870 [Pisolithus tinctorius]|nr:hypothetical protein BKA82DRAFT_4440870 [Pisolithus tinctorius]
MSISLVFTPFLSLFGRLVLLDNNSSLLLIVFIALQQPQPSSLPDAIANSLLFQSELVPSSSAAGDACALAHPTAIESSITIPLPSSPSIVFERSPSPMLDSSAAHSSDSSSSASLSSDLYDSTPSPPTKLEDQVQVAYALDDIRLAKTLLLKLKGIEVTGSDDDPRIDEVCNEDFDVYFVPSGPLTLEEADGRPMEGTQCKQRTSGDTLHRDNNVTQGLVPRDILTQTLHEKKPHFNTASWYPPTPPAQPPPGKSFDLLERQEVVKCMKGRLFPPDAPEQVEDARCTVGLDSLSNNTRHRCRLSAHTQLLDNLLQPVEWKGDRWKAQAAGVPCRRVANLRSPSSVTQHPYPPPPSSESLTSMSSLLSLRLNSWVSFGSWRSSCTDVTIPDTQVATPSECSLPVLLPSTHENQRDYHYPRCSFIPISLEESPLTLPRPLQSERQASRDNHNGVVSAERAASSSDRMRQSILHWVS